jgi:triosephosphate isomerase (TIM)
MPTRKPLIAGNWKMFKTGSEAVATAQNLVQLVKDVDHTEVMIAPTFTALALVQAAVKGTNVALGAQNLFWEAEGAFTGEISTGMLLAAGCTHVIIGHSERRQFFGETDETVNKKVKAAVAAGLIPVMCVGESERERDENKTFSVLDKQVAIGLEGLSLEDAATLVLAYEPIWAIGTGKTATKEQAQEVHRYLREWIENNYTEALAQSTRILYGGSVKPDNVTALMAQPDVDGALVGGASLDAETFSKIVKF